MSKPNYLQKVELVVIIVLTLLFFTWALSKCNQSAQAEREARLAQEQEQQSPPTDTTNIKDDNEEATDKKSKADLPKVIKEKYTPLFVTINGLKLRKTPDLNSDVILTLKLYEEVEFLNEVTDTSFTINLGYEEATEPWVKIKHRKGHVGWVFGAGVDYYKYKRSGVLE